ncbi:MAG: NAD(P)H-dependent oxidoreductase [Legionellales bacterium]|nr:NAD(P)H-dependent oxidoreductase [Legionellales bacterium]
MSKKIGILVGSLRKESFNRKIAKQLIELAPASLTFEFIEINNLPFYNEDLETAQQTLPEWKSFREKIKACDGILFCTPEYNRSVPAVLKNAIDVGSRPYGQSVWQKKPAGIISVSVGGIGGFGANHHLRQSLVFLDMPCLQQPEAYIGNASQLFNEANQITQESTLALLKNYSNTFAAWVEAHS